MTIYINEKIGNTGEGDDVQSREGFDRHTFRQHRSVIDQRTRFSAYLNIYVGTHQYWTCAVVQACKEAGKRKNFSVVGQQNGQLAQTGDADHRFGVVLELGQGEFKPRVDDENGCLGDRDLADVGRAFFDFDGANAGEVAVGEHHLVVDIFKVKDQVLQASEANGIDGELAQIARNGGNICDFDEHAVLAASQVTHQ